MMQKEDPENFLFTESKVNQLVKLIDDVANANKMDADQKKPEAKKELGSEVTEKEFLITSRDSQSLIRSTKQMSTTARVVDLEHFSFSTQITDDQDSRTKMRMERERIAHNFRIMGNHDYRNQRYEKAIFYYTKALEQIDNTQVLYCNRALCYMKLRNYKSALFDLEYVLNKLDRKNINAWLYRAACYKRMNDEASFNRSVEFAREYNIKEFEYIDNFLLRMQTEL